MVQKLLNLANTNIVLLLLGPKRNKYKENNCVFANILLLSH